MKFTYIFNEYLEFCKLYRKNGTYNAYKKSYIFLLKIFTELDIEDHLEMDANKYNLVIQYIKENRDKKIAR